MKKYLNLFILLTAIFVVDYSFEDSDGDRSKEIITIHYSNRQEDRLVMDKTLIDSPRMYEEIEKISHKRTSQR